MKNIHAQAFIFDLDGTILETIQDIADSCNYSLALHNFKTHSYDEYKNYVGNGSIKLVERALGENNLSSFDIVFKDYYDYYLTNYCVKTKPYNGIIETLSKAKDKGIKLFVYTNKPSDIALAVIKKCFPKDFFEKVIGVSGKDVKPNPIPFIKRTENYNLDFSKVMYFGDSTTDIQTAYNLNCCGIYSVLWGYQSKEKLSNFELKPTAFLSSPYEIEKIIDEII